MLTVGDGGSIPSPPIAVQLVLLALLYAVESPFAPWYALFLCVVYFLQLVLWLDKTAPRG